MDSVYNLFNKFFGKIILTKKRIFLPDYKIVIIISHNLKIFKIKSNTTIKNFNFREEDILNFETLKKWSSENKFNVTCISNNSSIKRSFYSVFIDNFLKKKLSKKKIREFYFKTNKKIYRFFQKKTSLNYLYNFFDIYLILI
jgi:hypothetical protein